MTAATDLTARNKLVVGAFYEGGARGDLAVFGARLHPEFVVEVPDYLPWGGAHGPEAYLRTVLPQVGAALDFTRFRYVSVTAEDDRVVALIQVGVAGSDAMIKISEHWAINGEKAVSLWVAYYDPGALLEQISARSRAAGVPGAREPMPDAPG